MTKYKDYRVTMTQGRDSDFTEHTAKNAADAISQARRFWNDQDGRTRTTEQLPRHFRAERIKE